MGRIEEYVMRRIKTEGAIHLTLIDPEKVNPESAGAISAEAESAGTTGIMIGGSTAVSVSETEDIIKQIKEQTKIPVVLFPSNISSISRNADAIWFMSLMNSRNPYFITGAQALGALLVMKYGLEPISLGYIIVGEGGTAGLVGEATPIPYDRPELASMYSLAAEYLGMHFVYLEGGSGAKRPVPTKMISSVKKVSSVPLIVGGGIRNSVDAEDAAKAGADVIVTGTILEKSPTGVRERLEPIVRALRHR